jgi:hypothetical protein
MAGLAVGLSTRPEWGGINFWAKETKFSRRGWAGISLSQREPKDGHFEIAFGCFFAPFQKRKLEGTSPRTCRPAEFRCINRYLSKLFVYVNLVVASSQFLPLLNPGKSVAVVIL